CKKAANQRPNRRTPHRKVRGFSFLSSVKKSPTGTFAMTSSTPRIAIVGYGSQGRAHALNLRDSGFDVTIGLRPGGPTELKAKADGFTVKTPAEAVKGAQIVAVLTPDMVQPQLYGEVIEPNMDAGA